MISYHFSKEKHVKNIDCLMEDLPTGCLNACFLSTLSGSYLIVFVESRYLKEKENRYQNNKWDKEKFKVIHGGKRLIFYK